MQFLLFINAAPCANLVICCNFKLTYLPNNLYDGTYYINIKYVVPYIGLDVSKI